jgi:ABC-type uncharacterized transport system permease subunit
VKLRSAACTLARFCEAGFRLDGEAKGVLAILAWIFWVLVVMGAAQHYGWVTP